MSRRVLEEVLPLFQALAPGMYAAKDGAIAATRGTCTMNVHVYGGMKWATRVVDRADHFEVGGWPTTRRQSYSRGKDGWNDAVKCAHARICKILEMAEKRTAEHAKRAEEAARIAADEAIASDMCIALDARFCPAVVEGASVRAAGETFIVREGIAIVDSRAKLRVHPSHIVAAVRLLAQLRALEAP